MISLSIILTIFATICLVGQFVVDRVCENDKVKKMIGFILIVIGAFGIWGGYKTQNDDKNDLLNKIALIDTSQRMREVETKKDMDSILNLLNPFVLTAKAKFPLFSPDIALKMLNHEIEQNKKIKKLEDISSKTERGIVSNISFNGAHIDQTGPGHIEKSRSPEMESYKELDNLESGKKFNEIINLCDSLIIKFPKWGTPYYFKALALLIIDQKKNRNQAMKLLEYIEKNFQNDPEYILRIADTYAQLGNKSKSDELRNSVRN